MWLLRNKIKDKGYYARTCAWALFLYIFFDFICFDGASAVINAIDLEAPTVDLGGVI